MRRAETAETERDAARQEVERLRAALNHQADLALRRGMECAVRVEERNRARADASSLRERVGRLAAFYDHDSPVVGRRVAERLREALDGGTPETLPATPKEKIDGAP